jgi:hypothetical protein
MRVLLTLTVCPRNIHHIDPPGETHLHSLKENGNILAIFMIHVAENKNTSLQQ